MKYVLKVILVVLSSVFSVDSDVSDINRVFFSPGTQEGGYFYPPPPVPPVQFDEPPVYLPPIFADEIPFIPTQNPPPASYLPPTAYLPPSSDIYPPQLPPTVSYDDTVVVPAQPFPSQGLSPPQFRIENMSCTQGMNFRATFKMTNDSPQFPVVDDATDGCISPINGNMFKIDLENFNSMLKCGVRKCRSKSEDNMCVVVRIPTVKGVRLPEDGMVTLMCTPQERVVSQTKHVKLGSNKIQQISRARSNNGFVATGGTQKDLKTRIGILRKRPGSNSFDQNVQADSIIQLGEELVLRAVVTEGDGWKSSRIGPVLMTGLNSKKSALLVNQQGCVNPAMKSICPRQPMKINPLSTELHFRAFLFQESPQGDEMVVSVRTQGCLNFQDCVRTDSCTDDLGARSKRDLTQASNNISTKNHLESSVIAGIKNWESQLSFKVEPVRKKNKILNDNTAVNKDFFNLLVLFFVGVAIMSLLGIGLLLWQIYWRAKRIQ